MALAARQFMRVAFQTVFRRGDGHLAQFSDGDFARVLVRDFPVGLQNLDHLGFDGQYRVQGHHRILENHTDPVSSDVAHGVVVQAGQVATLEQDFTVVNAARLGQKVDDRKGCDGLSGPTFAHDPKPFALFQREADALQRPQDFASHGELDAQVFHL